MHVEPVVDSKHAEFRPELEPEKSEPIKAESYGEYERELILKLMIAHRGNKSAVASEMGISRKTLYAKLDKYKI
ncbi:MAG: helix-turn-helix domain-containing protein [Candidatus Scatomorpha sp.]